jgi:hypothetical protein
MANLVGAKPIAYPIRELKMHKLFNMMMYFLACFTASIRISSSLYIACITLLLITLMFIWMISFLLILFVFIIFTRWFQDSFNLCLSNYWMFLHIIKIIQRRILLFLWKFQYQQMLVRTLSKKMASNLCVMKLIITKRQTTFNIYNNWYYKMRTYLFLIF